MNLRTKLILYLLFIHLVFAVTTYFLFLENRYYLFATEAFFLISFLIAIVLIRTLFKPLDIIRTGTEIIKEKDFTSKFQEVGQPEMDELIGVYNKMIDQLREERLKLHEKNYFIEKIIQASPAGILTFDFDGKIDLVNPAIEKLFLKSADNLSGKTLEELNTAFTRELHRLKTGESKVIEIEGGRKLKCHRSQFLDRGFSKDFILIEELTEEIRQSEKSAYEKIIRIMAHEVNNSIGAANSLLHSCLNYKSFLPDENKEDFETALNVAISRADHLNQFIRRFADVVRLPNPRIEDCDVKILLENITNLMKIKLDEKNIKITWDIQEKLPLIPMDKSQMEHVFVNIFKNSIEAIEKDGIITIHLGVSDGRNFAAIEDTGSGIPPEILKDVFSPYFSTKENGYGIGLTMVQEILTRHKFEFSLNSHPGGPTKFVIYF